MVRWWTGVYAFLGSFVFAIITALGVSLVSLVILFLCPPTTASCYLSKVPALFQVMPVFFQGLLLILFLSSTYYLTVGIAVLFPLTRAGAARNTHLSNTARRFILRGIVGILILIVFYVIGVLATSIAIEASHTGFFDHSYSQ